MSLHQQASLRNRSLGTADNPLANSRLTSTEYCIPVLGVIFLRHAANRFNTVTAEIKASSQ
jgi:type I restriction enzyme M protein